MYGIIDVGSNTMVLNVYSFKDSMPVIEKHISTPVRLINYVKDGIMTPEGIENAKDVIFSYKNTLDKDNVEFRRAFITEPCRIHNQKELVDALSESGIEVIPLSGEMEAKYDFMGASITVDTSKKGIAFDVGGGSTELISYENSKIIDAMSFPLGCVRLSHLEIDTDQCRIHLEKALEEYPSLNMKCDRLIGIGGTVRAIGRLCNALYNHADVIYKEECTDLFHRLIQIEPKAHQALKDVIKPSRQKVLPYGMHMVLEIFEIFDAKEILISPSGIREGFLLDCTKKGDL